MSTRETPLSLLRNHLLRPASNSLVLILCSPARPHPWLISRVPQFDYCFPFPLIANSTVAKPHNSPFSSPNASLLSFQAQSNMGLHRRHLGLGPAQKDTEQLSRLESFSALQSPHSHSSFRLLLTSAQPLSCFSLSSRTRAHSLPLNYPYTPTPCGSCPSE